VIRETAGEIHDPVVGQGSGNEDLHKDL
jgi:hypothetical protein